MRNLFVFNMVTVDGFFEGPTPWDIGWHRVDEEFNEFAIQQLDTMDLLIFGRATYQGMAGYWPSPEAVKNDPEVAARMNGIQKLVFSKTLEKAEWSHTRLIKEVDPQDIRNLKEMPGKDIAIFGSANLTAAFAKHNLLDEYRLIVNPIILGKGSPMFGGFSGPIKLALARTKPFKNGNILLVYQPTAE
jgi:dihydrofolate reductase